ncbi:MAG: hypothetical protein ABI085_04140 [Gemmatimonadaceae bacterium]
MMRAAQDVARELLGPWLETEQRSADTAYRESMARFIAIADGMLDRLADSGMPELESLRGALDAYGGLRTAPAFVFNEVMHVAEPASPLRFAADVLLGLFARSALQSAAHEFLGWLLEMNSSRVQSDVDRRAAEDRRALESEIRVLLREVESSAKRAVARATEARAAGAEGVDRAVRRVQDLEDRLTRCADARR